MTLTPAIRDTLSHVTTATLTTVLLKKGLRRTWMRGTRPLGPGQKRAVGPAFTLRFIPMREDLATPESWSSPRSSRAAIEEMPEGAIVVAGTEGNAEAGIVGDILCARMAARGVAALVTEGAVRDGEGIRRLRFPTWCGSEAAPPSIASVHFVNWQEPIGCGGVAVLPGDIVVADEDGAVVIPAALLDDVAKEADAQERLEAWVIAEVEKGAALPGLYPPDAATRARYERERPKG